MGSRPVGTSAGAETRLVGGGRAQARARASTYLPGRLPSPTVALMPDQATLSTARGRLVSAVLALAAVVAIVGWLVGGPERVEVSRQSFLLYTHCGIDRATIDGKHYVADPPLYRDGEYGNPPAGWGDPQPGEMTVYSDGTAVFSHPAGRKVKFVEDAKREADLPMCA